jgi:hypothetical protein
MTANTIDDTGQSRLASILGDDVKKGKALDVDINDAIVRFSNEISNLELKHQSWSDDENDDVWLWFETIRAMAPVLARHFIGQTLTVPVITADINQAADDWWVFQEQAGSRPGLIVQATINDGKLHRLMLYASWACLGFELDEEIVYIVDQFERHGRVPFED